MNDIQRANIERFNRLSKQKLAERRDLSDRNFLEKVLKSLSAATKLSAAERASLFQEEDPEEAFRALYEFTDLADIYFCRKNSTVFSFLKQQYKNTDVWKKFIESQNISDKRSKVIFPITGLGLCIMLRDIGSDAGQARITITANDKSEDVCILTLKDWLERIQPENDSDFGEEG